jgi:cell division protein FtsI (penicillin-binding protein 3)
MSEFKPQNRIVVGDDIQHLLINNLENKKTSYLENNPITIARERLKIALCFFIVFFFIFSVRNAFLSVFPGDVISEPQHSLALSVKKPLPDIYDRTGKNLLVTTFKTTRAAVVKRSSFNEFDIHKAANQLSPYLNEDPQELLERLSSGKYVEIANDISEKQQYDILNSGVAEVEFHKVWRRVYPSKTLAAHILGYSNRDFDQKSSSGFERWLYKNQIQNDQINLTINLNVQNHLENILEDAIIKYDAEASFGIILNVNNGEIIALASLPNFDPNTVNKFPSLKTADQRFNRALQGSYELGSVMKIFTLAMALEEEKVNLLDEFDVWKCINNGRKKCLSDYRKSKVQFLNAAQCLINSSNICMAQISHLVGLETQKRFLSETGLLDEQFIELYEMGKPILPDRWNKLTMEQISFGQGLGVVPLSFVSAAAAIINGGYLIEPTLYLRDKNYGTNAKLISSDVSRTMRYVMRDVVKNGSGKKADIDGYNVIGKTGTADKHCETGGYCGRMTSFVGAFPGNNPEYIILVTLDNPKGKRSSAYWNAAPVAGEVIKLVAPILNIPTQNSFDAFQEHVRADIQ